MRIGLISDTHGLLRPEVFAALEGVELILHAGDVGSPDILVELAAMAPVHAVFGNTDGFEIRDQVSKHVRLELDGWQVLVTHGDELGSPRPESLHAEYPDADVIVYGHTHVPLVEVVEKVLIVNPGAAGPARFRLKPSVAVLELAAGRRDLRHVQL